MKFSCAAIALCLASSALATPTKTTAFTIPLTGTTLAKQPDLAGTVISDKVIPFSISSPQPDVLTSGGKIQVRVSRAKDGTLEYAWRLMMQADKSPNPVTKLIVTGFPVAVYDANWRIDGLGTAAPKTISSSGPSGGTMSFTFDFGDYLKPGESSRFIYIKTKAKLSKPSTGYVSAPSYKGADFAIQVPAG